MNKLVQWVEKTKVYPPSELFFQADSKQAKAEKRVVAICEDLYKLEVHTLSDMHTAFTVLANAAKRDIHNMKMKYIEELCGVLAFHVDYSVNALDAMHKKDPILQAYYKGWSVKAKELKDEIKALLIESFPDIDKAMLLSEMQYYYDSEKDKVLSK
ncbi:TPA: hypothetical protein OGU99_000702 [Escherichia coli]|nr:hypothetical protein [Escherichia coli O157]HCQ0858776.1 hypothetical protein [Escherichia coli]